VDAGRALHVLIAPDSFKGSLTSVEVARALAEGWRRARPGDEVSLAPLADGGEGTLDAIETSGGWLRRRAGTTDPIGRPIIGSWLDRESAAVIELATASGLSRLRPDERSPYGASTAGTGHLMQAAIDEGARSITLGIGGSATTDGGRGLLEALGADIVGPGPHERDWTGLQVDLSGLDVRLGNVRLRVACDVDNPLLGPHGAAATYGPQKGATPEDVDRLDARNAAWADALEAATRRRERDTPGAGAAGGTGFGLLCLADHFRELELVPGVEVVMEAAAFDDKLRAADLVITGEGRIDAQTGYGKTALGVAKRAAAAGVPCLAVGGSVEPDGESALAPFGATAIPVWQTPVPLDEAIAAGAAPIERCAERIAREWR